MKNEDGLGAGYLNRVSRKNSVKTSESLYIFIKEDKGGNACKTSFHLGCLFLFEEV